MGGVGTLTRALASARTKLGGRWLQATRAAWIIVTVLAVGLSIASVPVAYTEDQLVCAAGDACPYWRLVPEDLVALRELGLSTGFYAAYMLAAKTVCVLGFWVVGAVLFWRRPDDDRVVLFFSFMLVTFGASVMVDPSADIRSARDLLSTFLSLLGYVSFFASFYVFPDAHFVPRWTRWPLIVLALYGACLLFSPDNSRLHPAAWPQLLVLLLVLGLFGTMAFAQVYRYRRVSGPIERQQTKWVVFGSTAALTISVAWTLATEAFPTLLESGAPKIFYVLTEATVTNLSLFLIPLSIGIAILRYRLWDIDVVINRTLVYGALTAIVIGIYALTVGSLGTLLQVRGNFAVSLLAAGLVAVLFQPLRNRLQRGVNRLMYGERDDPYGVLSRLGRRLGTTLEPKAVLPTIVETVAGALKLPYAAIAMKQVDGFKTAAAYGSPTGEQTILPLAYQGETIGQLILAPRAPGDQFTPADRRLLEDLAHNAEVAVHAVRLADDLQRSRERLVSAREEERRRLRRDLHDGLGPTLAGLTFGLDAARNLLVREPKDADALLAQLKSQTQETVSDVRRLVYGLRPPALDDLGLVPAIREQAACHGRLAHDLPGGTGGEAGREHGSIFSVEAPVRLPPLPAAVEVACYRIAQEAMTNVARHARARACRVRLSLDEAGKTLELEVSDDGVGLPKDLRAGVGTTSMRERAAELGGTCSVTSVPAGGTRVLACLPLPAKEDE